MIKTGEISSARRSLFLQLVTRWYEGSGNAGEMTSRPSQVVPTHPPSSERELQEMAFPLPVPRLLYHISAECVLWTTGAGVETSGEREKEQAVPVHFPLFRGILKG